MNYKKGSKKLEVANCDLKESPAPINFLSRLLKGEGRVQFCQLF